MKRLLLSLTLCASPPIAHAQDAPAPPPVAPKAGLTGAFDWKLRLQVGQKWEIRTFMRMTQQQESAPPAPAGTLPHEPMPPMQIQIMQRSTLDYEVLSLDNFGASTVKVSMRELFSDTNTISDGKPFPDALKAHQQFHLTGLEGASILVKQAADGTVWSIVGGEALPARLLKATPAEQKSAAESILSQWGAEQYWRRFFQTLSNSLPKYPVIVSESWRNEVSAPMSALAQVTYTWKRTLKTRKNGVASIQEEATIAPTGFDINNPGNKTTISDYQGHMTGDSQIQEASGLPLAVNLTYQISSKVALDQAAQNEEAKKVEYTVNLTGESHLVMERKN